MASATTFFFLIQINVKSFFFLVKEKERIEEALMQHYHLVFAGDVAPDIDSGPGNSGQADMLGSSVPSPAPDPNLGVSIGCINPVIGNLKCNHHAGLGLELAALGELRQLPHPHEIGLGAGVDEAVGGCYGEDLPVFFEDRRDAPVGGG